MSTPTTNYGWLKPTVGGDPDQWGVQINSDLDGIDSTVKTVSTLANGKLSDAPVDNNMYARQNGLWQQVAGGGGASVTISATAPTNPKVGNLWWDSNGGNLYIWYQSTASSAWVDVVGGGAVPITPPSGAVWDGGASIWDGGASNWDVTS